MATTQFVARNGLIALSDSTISGSLFVSQSVTATSFTGAFSGSVFGYVANSQTSSFVTNNQTGSFATTGSNIFIGNQTVTGSILMSGSSFISGVDYIDFDTTASNAGAIARLKWNDTDGTLDLGLKGGNVTLQVGQEQLVRVVNKTGTNLTEAGYQAVRASGAQGNRLKVALAKGDNDGNSLDTLGLVTEDIAVNEEGFVTTSGLVRGINTTGNLQGETWADGDDIYLSPTTFGGVTNIPPTAPKHSVRLGYVVQSNASNGSIFVKVDNGYELGELHDVVDNSTTSSYGDLLVKIGSIWTNSKQLSGSYGLTGSLFIIGQGSNIVSQDSYKTNDFFLVRNSTTTLKVNSGVEVSSSVEIPFKISTNTGDNILFVSQSGMVVFATSSVLPEGPVPYGAFLFTSGALYIGID